MKSKLILILILIFPLITFANSEERRKELVGVIDEEINEISRLNKQIGARKPALLLRMAELYLEKARLIGEGENIKWLSLSPKERLARDEKSFFNESKKNYINAQKTCYYMLKRFKDFKGKDEVYYILAYNAKEFQQPNRAQQFFKKSLKFSKKGSETNLKSKLALAELYYNQKNYRKAEPLYRDALVGKKTRWWTKDAYNLSWCYFRNKKESKAIDLMRKVHDLSDNRNFVDVSDMVERDLAYFYSATGQTKKAIGFYKKLNKDVSSNLLKVGIHLKSKGSYKKAEKALSEALVQSKNKKELAAIGVELLGLYDRFGQVRNHLKVSEVLYELDVSKDLNKEQRDQLVFHVKKMSALLQKQVAGKTYRKVKKTRNLKAAYATRYFELQSKLNGNASPKSIFLAAETQYAISKFDRSADLYNQSYEMAKRKNDKKLMRLSLDGLLASLSGRGIPKSTTDKYLSKAFNLYLKDNPRSDRSNRIYQRLFSQYYKKGDLDNAERVLEKYQFHFPRQRSKQEAMLARIMDGHRANGNKTKIAKWVGKINAGEIIVSKPYALKLKEILLSMEFDKVQRLSSEGDKLSALKAYFEIYKKPSSSSDAKKNAAYNIAVLYHEKGDKENSYKWIMKAMNLMSSKDIKRFDDSIFLIASGLFEYRETQKSAHVYEYAFKKLCRQRSKNKEMFFKNANALYLSDGNIEKSIEVSKYSEKCGINKKEVAKANLDVLQEAAVQERWTFVKSLISKLEASYYSQVELIAPIAKLRDVLITRGRIRQAKNLDRKINVIYAKAKTQGKDIPLEALDIISSYKVESLEDISRQMMKVKLRFPEKVYNKALKRKFSLLEKLTTKAVDLFRIGSGQGTVQGYKILVESYSSLSKEITEFMPVGTIDYIKSFKKGMRSIAEPLSRKARDYRREARQKITLNKILSPYNYFFMSEKFIPIMPQYIPRNLGVIMDRGGKK